MSGKFVLIIGNTEYIDPRLARLTAAERCGGLRIANPWRDAGINERVDR